ncbi:hypothetical protein TVAG_094230 [Trichomonas vaginalis G3]|uniref:Uncharacterized protein n=1 Tax=Trichomonas vaginalis (strain ATCC PRA-98 / G3) TaxID=412133 RepID=A2DBP5_TRIV3|nr:hypothetical protein TVAG_094230 [Trichomonas vaginalis G3]|eukprot:XP_001583234.1 hypothetical protein [Trichomonas vaginalis G3]
MKVRFPNEITQQRLVSVVDKNNKDPSYTKFLVSIIASVRDQNILNYVLQVIFGGELNIYSQDVFNYISNSIYDRSFNELTLDAVKNFRALYKFISSKDTQEYKAMQGKLLLNLVHSIDNGYFSEINLQNLTFAVNEYKYHQYLQGPQFLLLTSVLIIKLLRFFQDVILIINNSKFSREPKSETLKIKHIAEDLFTKFSGFTVDLFANHANEIMNYIPKEVTRILYDPRSYQRMRFKLEEIYKIVEKLQYNEKKCRTEYQFNYYIISYKLYKHLFILFTDYTKNKNDSTILQGLDVEFYPKCELYDIDLIASDIARNLSHNWTFSQDPFQIVAFERLIHLKLDTLYRSFDKSDKSPVVVANNTYESYFNAIFTDILYCEPVIGTTINDLRHYFMPLGFFFMNEQLQAKFADIIGQRLLNGDFQSFKRRSLGILTQLYEKTMDPPNSFRNRLKAIPRNQINEKLLRELLSASTVLETRRIPDNIINYNKNGGTLNSAEGFMVMQTANEVLQAAIEEIKQEKKVSPNNGNTIVAVINGICGSTVESIKILMDKIQFEASFYYAVKFDIATQPFLIWIMRNNLYEEINNNSFIANENPKVLETALVPIIKENIHPWMRLVTKCNFFATNAKILETVCFFASVGVVQDMIDLDTTFDVVDLLITSGKQNWHPDAKFNILSLLRTQFLTPPDFINHFSFFEQYFTQIPQFAMTFFENQIKLMGVTDQIMEFVKKLHSIGGECSNWSKKLYSILSANRRTNSSSSSSSATPSSISSPILVL